MRLALLKTLKYLGTTLLVLAVFILILPYFISLKTYKEEIVSKTKEALGRDLSIEGDIKFRILPRPYVKLKDLKLSSSLGSADPTLLSIKEIEIVPSILPLFSGRIEVDKIILEQPTIFLEKLKNGRGNWEFDLKTNTPTPIDTLPTPVTKDSQQASKFNIKTVKINKALLTYRDGQDIKKIKDLDLTLEIENLKGPIDFNLALEAFDLPLEITGRLEKIGSQIPLDAKIKVFGEKLFIGGTFDSERTNFIGDLELKGTLKNLKRFLPDIEIPTLLKEKYKLKAKINANSEKIALHNVDFDLKPLKATGGIVVDLKKTTGTLNLTVMPGSIQLELRPDTPKGNQFSARLSLKAGNLSQLYSALQLKPTNIPAPFLKTFSFATHLTYQDQKINLRGLNFQMGKAKLDGQVSLENWNQRGRYAFDLQTPDIGKLSSLLDVKFPSDIGAAKFTGVASGDPTDINFNVSVSAANALTKAKGRLQKKDQSLKPSFTITTSGKNLKATLKALGQKDAPDALKRFSITSEISGDIPQRMKFDVHKSYITLASNQVDLKGTMDLFLSGLKPKINVNIILSHLDLDRLIESVSPSGAKQSKNLRRKSPSKPASKNLSTIKSRWSHEKLDLGFLRNFDGDITLSIPKVKKGSLIFDSMKMTIRVANGILDLTSLTGGLYGGLLTLKGRLSSQKNQPVTLTAHLKDAKLKNIVPKQKEIKVLKGLFSLDADLTSQGKSEYQYISNLSGSLNFRGKEGVISGFDIQRIVQDLSNVQNLASALTLLNTSFSGGQTTFNSIDCIASISKGEARLKKFILDANGADVSADGTLNLLRYWMNISLKVTLEAEDIPSFGVKLSGPLDNPNHDLKTGKLEQYLMKNVFNTVLDSLSNGKGGAQNILKGVLGFGAKKTNSQEKSQEKQTQSPQEKGEPQKEIDAIGEAVGGLLKDLF